MHPCLSVKGGIVPQKLPALTAHDGVGVAGPASAAFLVTDVFFDEVVDVLFLDVVELVLDVVLDVVEVALDVVELVLDVGVVFDEDVGVVLVEDAVEVEEPPGVRYQLTGASPRQSPTVTPFQPLALIRS